MIDFSLNMLVEIYCIFFSIVWFGLELCGELWLIVLFCLLLNLLIFKASCLLLFSFETQENLFIIWLYFERWFQQTWRNRPVLVSPFSLQVKSPVSCNFWFTLYIYFYFHFLYIYFKTGSIFLIFGLAYIVFKVI